MHAKTSISWIKPTNTPHHIFPTFLSPAIAHPVQDPSNSECSFLSLMPDYLFFKDSSSPLLFPESSLLSLHEQTTKSENRVCAATKKTTQGFLQGVQWEKLDEKISFKSVLWGPSKKAAAMNQEEGPHPKATMLTPWSWTSKLRPWADHIYWDSRFLRRICDCHRTYRTLSSSVIQVDHQYPFHSDFVTTEWLKSQRLSFFIRRLGNNISVYYVIWIV